MAPVTNQLHAEYERRRAELISHCACVADDARDCIARRYGRDPAAPKWTDYWNEACECRCHDDLRDLEREIYGQDDDA